MASNAPCHAGVLPRPKKELVGRRIQYYVDAFDRSFAESRTPEAEALVVVERVGVRREGCRSRRSSTARPSPSSRACRPASRARRPASGAGATAAIAVGGAAVVGGGVALATSGSSDGRAAAPRPAARDASRRDRDHHDHDHHHHAAGRGFNPVFKVFKGATLVDGRHRSAGTEPLVLRFDMCESTGPYPHALRASRWTACMTRRTGATRRSPSPRPGASELGRPGSAGVRRSAHAATYSVRMTIRSEGAEQRPQGATGG